MSVLSALLCVGVPLVACVMGWGFHLATQHAALQPIRKVELERIQADARRCAQEQFQGRTVVINPYQQDTRRAVFWLIAFEDEQVRLESAVEGRPAARRSKVVPLHRTAS